MKNNQKRGFNVWWAIIIFIIIIIGIVGGIFWKSNPEIVNDYIENVIDSVKDIIGVQDSPSEQLNNDTGLNNTSIKSTSNASQDSTISGGGGGGGGSSSATSSEDNTIIIPENYETFSSLEELFNYENPTGNKVNVRGIAIQIAGVSTSDYFFFTDDNKVMNDINYMLFNKVEFHVTVYNSLNVQVPQSIISLTGTVVNCKQNDDGNYCIDAESIE
jgi:hypothetical protein